MGCNNSTSKVPLSQDDLESILAIDPIEWNQAQVIKWLQLTHDGDLRDLVEPFKAQKISGVTFVKLTEENLKEDLEIKQFGLRDGFISARNKLLERRNAVNRSTTSSTPNNQTDDLKKHNSSSTKTTNITITDQSNQSVDVNKHNSTSTKSSKSNNEASKLGENVNTTKNVEKQRSDRSDLTNKTDEKSKSNLNPNPMTSKHEDSMTNSSLPNRGKSVTNHAMDTQPPSPSPIQPQQQQQQQANSHQSNLSNNHLITKPPNTVRHNQSFDDTAGSNNNNGGGGGGGYEEIPDSFSPTAPSSNPMSNNNNIIRPMSNVGFNNMPNTSFQDDGMQEEDQYARIDFADLNHSEVPPSQPVQNIHTSMPTHPAMIPGQGTNFHPLGSYQQHQSNQVPFGGMAVSMTNMSNGTGGHSPNPPPHSQGHTHNQTGSNYDELPLEFIHNIPNPSNNGYPNGGMGASAPNNRGAYEEIDFDVHDDNISQAPSNPDLSQHQFMNGNRPTPKLSIGQCVQVHDSNTGKWLDAEVEKFDNQFQRNVYVKYLKAPNGRALVPIQKIRTLLPPSHASIVAPNPSIGDMMNGSKAGGSSHNGDGSQYPNDINAGHSQGQLNGIPASQVDPTGHHGPSMTMEEKQIHEFARDLWKTLHKIDVKTIPDAHNEPIRGFSGKELVRHVKKHLKQHVNNLSDKDVIARCSDLVKYAYIRLIASAKQISDNSNGNEDDGNNGIPKTDKDDTKLSDDKEFASSEKYLYQFENEKHREFIKDDQPDRRAWTRGTKVQIYSSTLGGWQTGTVVEVNNDTLTITYGPPQQQMRKTLDRYQDDLVKSTQQFIDNRKGWNKDSEIEVYSHGQHIWCQGRIEEVLSAKENQPVDIFRVFYTNNDDKDFSKYVDRWSPDLREVQQLSPKLAKYKKGTKVRVWSNSKQTWISGVVIDVVPTYEVVNVRYGDHEKLVPVSSDDIKLLDDEE